MTQNRVSIAVTGIEWMGSGNRAIHSVLKVELGNAQEEILITAYRITSAADVMLDGISDALDRGVRVTMVLNRLQSQDGAAMARLNDLQVRHGRFQIHEFIDRDFDLHAKCVILDRRIAIIGSSNLSRRGLSENHELAAVIHGPAAGDAASAIEKLIQSRRVKRVQR